MSDNDRVVDMMQEWLSNLPQNTVTVIQEKTIYGNIIEIIPKNENSSRVEFYIGNEGTFDVSFGKGFAFENLPISIDLILDICNSIKEGRLVEKIREWNGKIIWTEGKLDLSKQSLWDKGCNHWAALLRLGKIRQISYEPWIKSK